MERRSGKEPFVPCASSNTSPATPDPLSDVLGRYRAWASSQRSVKSARSLNPGARDLSYEDALRANRYPARRPSPDLKPEDKSDEADASDTNANPKHPTSPAEMKQKRGRTRSREGRAKPETNTTDSPPVAVKRRTRPRKPDHSAKLPEFRDVLDGTVALSNSANASVRPEKSVWLTLRVSESEQAVIQARAAEADLSVSAYLRQCAFEVESLRDQVKRALAELRAPALPTPALPKNDQLPMQETAPGVFRALLRKAARIFSREKGFSATA